MTCQSFLTEAQPVIVNWVKKVIFAFGKAKVLKWLSTLIFCKHFLKVNFLAVMLHWTFTSNMKWQHSSKTRIFHVRLIPKNGAWWTCWLLGNGPRDSRRLAALLAGRGRGRGKVNIQVKSPNCHQRFPRFCANLPLLKMPTPALVSLCHHRSAMTQPTVSSIAHPTGPSFSPFGWWGSLLLFSGGC